jgi:tetratricopeptide (TPR) repeat protein
MATTTAAEEDDDDDSVTSRIARGKSCYNAGLYKHAAEDFARLAEVDTTVTWKRNKRPRPEHKNALSPQLAFEADAALCRARSSATPESLKDALEINERYRRVLRGAETNRDVIVSSMLLAAVSAIWLHMKLDDFVMARTVAWESIQWACSLVTNTRNAVWTEHEALKLLSRALPKSDHSVSNMTHALNILELASPLGTSYTNTAHMNVEPPKEEEGESASISGEFIAKQHLTRALTLHRLYREGDSMAKQLRDEHLHLALNGTSLMLARKISALIQGVEALDESVCVDAATEELAQVLSRTNPAELNLLGCLLARSNNTITKALVPLKQALELSESFGNSQLRRGRISCLGSARHRFAILRSHTQF